MTVKLTLASALMPQKVVLWDGEQQLGERSKAPWSFEVKLNPGIHALFATVEQAGDPVRTSRPHTIVVGP